MLTKVDGDHRTDEKFSGRGKYLESDLQTITRECASSPKPSRSGKPADYIHSNDDL